MKFLRIVILSLLIFCVVSPVTYAVLWGFELAWVPVGVADPKLTTVVGDSWAITSDNHFYFQNERGKKKWWESYSLVNGEDQITWGIAEKGNIIISTPNGIYLNTYKIPAVPFLPNAIGGTYYCDEDEAVKNSFFAIASDQLALYDHNNKIWRVTKLAHPIRSSVVLSSFCQLFFIADGELHYLSLLFQSFQDIETSKISEHSYAFSEYGGITTLTTSGRNIWALTGSGEILDIKTDFHAENFITWEKLPSPPKLANPLLISGFEGFTFSGLDPDKLDLWIKNENETYRYNRQFGTWDKFTFPYGQLTSISSITTSSETVGYSITRLAIANGKVYRQHPLNAELTFTFPFCVLPILLFASFMISGTIMIKRSQSG